MSGRYRPDESALPGQLWRTIHLANRDLSSLVPINFVTHAGVSLTSACFAHGIFEDSRAEKCISNLLAAQFRRFIVDLYWDPSSRQFMFCPVSISSVSRSLHSSSLPLLPITAGSRSIPNLSLSKRAEDTTLGFERIRPRWNFVRRGGLRYSVRQAASSTVENASNDTARTSGSSITAAVPVATSTDPSGTTVDDIGPFQCSPTLNLSFFASLIMDYINNTPTNLNANLLFLQFNVHAADSEDASTNPAVAVLGIDLPSPAELVGSALGAVASSFSYQPSELLNHRANLNDSWYATSASEQPISEYFITENFPGGQSTPDGWPSERFVELQCFKRVLLGWGIVDRPMEDYDFAGDSDVVFPQNYLLSSTDVRPNSTKQPAPACFFNVEQESVGRHNSSWAVSFLNENSASVGSLDKLQSLATNLTSCGIAPILNVTLNNQTADQNSSLYVQFVQSTIWNWAQDEPRNFSISDANGRDHESTQGQFRCALMDTSTATTSGRWRVEYCSMHHRVACRIANQPYLWQLSDESVPFSEAEVSCKPNSSFSVPRTTLENTYLYHHILSISEAAQSNLSGDGSGVWLNFNSLDTEACWVANQQNGSCPYFDEDALRQRTVLVPVIAALVVLLLTALTLFVKCNKNRRNSRKRVRGEGGWDYEGVPRR
ncbi:hypothetical protein GJ744_007990 [Endocarpon pusillum]|uniref:Maintenance of telomere capping protein 6 n=1 Tax=Endocarpon pusillum TaxID=364733 RepID=A0A8H7E4U6_9EURO|nr:hypothetical protein GJ744_007990 [Endocarpon pusillum]